MNVCIAAQDFSTAGGTLLHLVAPSCNNLFRNARDVLVFKVTMDVLGVIVSSVFLGAVRDLVYTLFLDPYFAAGNAC